MENQRKLSIVIPVFNEARTIHEILNRIIEVELHYGFGWKRPAGAYVYSWDWDHYYQKDIDTTLNSDAEQKLILEGRAFLQVLFQEFIDM